MAVSLNYWGPSDGGLSLESFDTLFTSGYNQAPEDAPAATLDGRVEFITVDDEPAVKMTVKVGDSTVSGGYRTEFVLADFAHIADWVGEGVPGANGDAAYRDIRYSFMVPEQDLSFLSNSGAYFICGQVHQTNDDDDTAGFNPIWSAHVKVDAYGKYRFCIVRNEDTDEITTVDNGAIHRKEICSWPFRFNEWQDIHTHVRWSYSSLGYCTIYRDRRPIFIETEHANCQNNSLARGGSGNYPQFGVYTNDNATAHSVIHRGLLNGGKTATFAEMYPELSGAIPLERVSGPVASGVYS
jgi:hypothetical protein